MLTPVWCDVAAGVLLERQQKRRMWKQQGLRLQTTPDGSPDGSPDGNPDRSPHTAQSVEPSRPGTISARTTAVDRTGWRSIALGGARHV